MISPHFHAKHFQLSSLFLICVKDTFKKNENFTLVDILPHV